jgi:N-methylhydantoinase B
MTIDYSDMAGQVKGCINSGYYGGGRTTARVAFKYLIASNEPANEGTFRPLKLILPDGKILSAHPTAPMGNYSQPFPTVIDAIIKALESALPERVTGAHFGTFSGVRFRGKRPDSGAPFDCHDSGHGGWGACASHDGAGPFRTMAHGDTRIIPIELQESMYPYRIVEFGLRGDSAGAGKFRGGLGFRKCYEILGPCNLQAMFDRVKWPPWGVQGRKPRPRTRCSGAVRARAQAFAGVAPRCRKRRRAGRRHERRARSTDRQDALRLGRQNSCRSSGARHRSGRRRWLARATAGNRRDALRANA